MKKFLILAPLLVSLLTIASCFDAKTKHKETKNSNIQSPTNSPLMSDPDKKNDGKTPAQVEAEEKKAKAIGGRNNNVVWGESFKGMDKAKNTENTIKDASEAMNKKVEEESK